MANSNSQAAWQHVRRVRVLSQPLGLGLPLAGAGGFLAVNMILAIDPGESALLVASTVLMAAGFAVMFLLGVGNLLAPLEQVWIRDGEVQLRLGKLVLRRLPQEKIHSIGAHTREVRGHGGDMDLYRIRIRTERGWPRYVWIDWSTQTEELLRTHLKHTIFLM